MRVFELVPHEVRVNCGISGRRVLSMEEIVSAKALR